MKEVNFQELYGATETVARYILPVILESSKDRRPEVVPIYKNQNDDYIYLRRKWKLQDLTAIIPILGTLSILREYDVKDTAAACAVKIAEYFNGAKYDVEFAYSLFNKIKKVIVLHDKDGIPGLSSIEELGDLVNEIISLVDNGSLFPKSRPRPELGAVEDGDSAILPEREADTKSRRIGSSILAILQTVIFPIIRLFLRR